MDHRDWDASQREALETYRDSESISILGGSGTGKTALLEEIAAREIAAGSTVAFLVHDRRAAHDSLLRLTRACGALSSDVSVRSLSAFCYAIVQEFAEQTGRVRPELISGAEQDARLRDIITSGSVSFPDYFDQDVLNLSSFRNELRNLITRAGELGLNPEELGKLGESYSQPLWLATAEVWSMYRERLAVEEASAPSARPPLRSAQRLDHSQLISAAVDMLKHWSDEASASNISIKPIRLPQWDYVFIDELHNAPRSILELITQLRRSGTRIICAGNPDSSVQGFRGAIFSLPLDICAPPPVGIQARPHVLVQRHRSGEKIARAMADIAARIRQPSLVKEFRQLRTPNPGSIDDTICGKSFANETEEAAGIASILRQWHLRDGVSYSDMAVLTRSRSAHEEIRRELRRRNVPVAAIGSQRPLAQHSAVAGLIGLIELALTTEKSAYGDMAYKAGKVRDVLLSPLFTLSPFEVDMLAQRLCGYERMRGGQSNKNDILALLADDSFAGESGIDIADKFHSILSSIARSDKANNAEEVLWCAWSSCDVTEKWYNYALGDSEYSELANENLDAIIQLFYFVQREAERTPGISIAQVIERLKSQELPQDSLVGGAKREDSITLITPASAQGREFSHLVIAHLNEGVWPNLTVRDSLVRTGELSDIVLGRYLPELSPAQRFHAQMSDVLDDELRQLYAGIGRACHSLVLTCVSNSQSRPSRFFDVLGFVKEQDSAGMQGHETDSSLDSELLILEQCSGGDSRFDMTGLVGQLRRYSHGEGHAAQRARQMLRELADKGVMQAEPAQWFDVYEPTSCEGRAEPISVSPSAVEATLECPLRGIMQRLGFEDKSDMRKADIGTLIHEIAAEYKDGGEKLSEDELCQQMLESFQGKFTAEFGEEIDMWEEKEKENYVVAIERLAHFLYERAQSGEYENVKAEYRFAFEEAGGNVRGSIDRLEIGKDASYIYDYKTGAVLSQVKAATNAQLQIYQLAIVRDRSIPKASGASLVYPNTKNKKAVERNQDVIDEKAVAERIAAYVDYEKSGVIPARACDRCKRCQYRVLCPLNAQGRIFS